MISAAASAFAHAYKAEFEKSNDEAAATTAGYRMIERYTKFEKQQLAFFLQHNGKPPYCPNCDHTIIIPQQPSTVNHWGQTK